MMYRKLVSGSILTFSLTLIGCVGKHQDSDPGSAVLADRVILIEDVLGYTPTPTGERRFRSLLLQGDRILALDPNADTLARFPNRQTVSGNGNTLLPGLIDAHGHVEGLGLAHMRVDLNGAASLDEALQRIAKFAAANRDLPWILGRGWNQERWPDTRMPTAADLGDIGAGRPIWLKRVGGHAGWANQAALRLADVDETTGDPPGGQILHAPDGNPSGVLVDNAMQLVEGVIPTPGRADRLWALLKAQSLLLAAGLTSAHDAGVDSAGLELYRELARSGALKLRIYAMLEGAKTLAEQDAPWSEGRLDVRSVKFYADGALGSRGASLFRPYLDDPGNLGLLFETRAEFISLIGAANAKGFQANIHAIGPRANAVVLNALAAVQRGQPSELRNRIEHAQVIAPRDLGRFAELGVIASMQPTHQTSDRLMAIARLGHSRLAGAYAWRSLLRSGAHLALGSDFPVEPEEPLYGLHAAVTGRDRAGEPPSGWRMEEVLTLPEAIRGFTLDAAYAAHAEELTGSLEPGKQADFIVLEGDLFALAGRAPQDLWRVRVLQTWIAGEQVYSAE